MTTQLGLYNGALRILGERKLASLTENREPRRLLDEAWASGATEGQIRLCLEMGQWTFATRTVRIDYSPSVDPSFGYRYAFDYPADWVRTVGVFSDEYCTHPLLEYATERRYWYASQQTIYVQYVSSHTTYGGDLSLWPELFIQTVQAALAMEIAPNLTQSEGKVQKAEQAWQKALSATKSNDAMERPTAFTPPGSWTLSRRSSGLRSSLSDRR